MVMGYMYFNNSSFMGFLRQSGTGFGPYRNGAYVSNNPPSYEVPYLTECWFDGTNEYATVQVGNSTTIGSTASSGNFAITYFCIGNNTNVASDGNAGSFNGYFSEILVYNTALSTSDRQKVEGYLSWKWGLQTNLSSSHPYYSSAPGGSSSSGITNFPKTITSGTLFMWFDASDSTTISYSGSNISQWNDKSGNGRNATPYSSNCTYNSTGYNGKPAISFSNSSLKAPLPSTNCFPNGITVIQAYYYTGGGWGTPFTVGYSNIGGSI
jgi:hypothetical protein